MKVDRIKTQGIAVFRTSTDASVVVDDLQAFVDRMNKEVLTRGVPQDLLEEAAQITEWRVEGAEIRFLIKTGRRVRAHAAALRIRKQLAPLLGSKRIGIRGLSMLQYTVEMTFDSPLPSNLSERIARISYVVKVNQRDATLRAVLTDLRDRDLERGVPDRIVSLIEKLVIESTAPARRPTPIIIMRGAERPIRFNKDPAQVAVELGWIKEFPGRGQWIYTPPFAELIYAIESLLMEHIVRKLGFQPFFLPKLIPLEVMKRMPGYLTSIPEGMYYVCPPPRDPEAFARFKERAFVEDEVDRVELRKVLKDPDYVLAPAQCEPFWQFLAGEVLDVNKLPYRFFDASGWTYRWEGGGVEGLVRLQEFRRIELVYVGTPE
ncbi:serine--tRNA ligase, partial [archaeon]|nr:serine--tRNA ligase [archaeon]